MAETQNKAMKKYVIYRLFDHSIVELTDVRPSFETLPQNQDFDTTENWMAVERYKSKLEAFINNKR